MQCYFGRSQIQTSYFQQRKCSSYLFLVIFPSLTSDASVAIMLTMFFLSLGPALLFWALPDLLGSLVALLPWRRLKLRFMSLMLLLSSEFRARWPRSFSSAPLPDDIRLLLQRTEHTRYRVVFGGGICQSLYNRSHSIISLYRRLV